MDNYNILADIDLSAYFNKGKVWLYTTVKSLKKDKFKDNERIIFRLTSPDIFDYSDDKGEIERHLDELLVQFDIPDYFVIKIFNKEKKLRQYQDTKCALPWIHLFVNPANGNIKPCCIADEFNPDSIVSYSTLNEAINCETLKKVRLDMLNNLRPLPCQNCYSYEDKNLPSSRLSANQKWKEINFFTERDGSIKPNFKYFDIRLNNVCNFKCRTCSYEFSSSIESESNKIWNTNLKSLKSENLAVYQKFYRSVLDNLDDIETFYFAGGEPLIMEEHYKILDILINKNKTNVDLGYNTNISVLEFKTVSIMDYWNQFKNVVVNLSLDAMYERAEYIRHGTKWTVILDNIYKIKEHCPHVILNIASTYSIYNSFHLIDFQKFIIESKLIDPNNIKMDYAYGDMNTIHLLPKILKDKLKNAIEEYLQYLNSCMQLKSQWANCLTYLYQEDKSFLLIDFLKTVDILDQYRNQKFFDTFPELIEIKNI